MSERAEPFHEPREAWIRPQQVQMRDEARRIQEIDRAIPQHLIRNAHTVSATCVIAGNSPIPRLLDEAEWIEP